LDSNALLYVVTIAGGVVGVIFAGWSLTSTLRRASSREETYVRDRLVASQAEALKRQQERVRELKELLAAQGAADRKLGESQNESDKTVPPASRADSSINSAEQSSVYSLVRLAAASESLSDGDGSDSWALLNEYYVQGLSQSRVSFRASLVAAIAGFVLIIGAVVASLLKLAAIDSVAVGLIAGTITEAVAALFFVQSNKSRSLMQDMHSRLRKDERANRQYFKALELVTEIRDQDKQDELKALFAQHFVRLEPSRSKQSAADLTT